MNNATAVAAATACHVLTYEFVKTVGDEFSNVSLAFALRDSNEVTGVRVIGAAANYTYVVSRALFVGFDSASIVDKLWQQHPRGSDVPCGLAESTPTATDKLFVLTYTKSDHDRLAIALLALCVFAMVVIICVCVECSCTPAQLEQPSRPWPATPVSFALRPNRISLIAHRMYPTSLVGGKEK